MKMKLGIFLALICFPIFVIAQTGRVVRITDGDTLVLLTSNKKQLKVRLKEIDAPERTQAFGRKSTQALGSICANTKARLKNISEDRYGRTLARVYCDGRDANAHMVEIGMAWVYDKYVSDHSLYELQNSAKKNSIGLWLDKEPTPPWLFRKQNR